MLPAATSSADCYCQLPWMSSKEGVQRTQAGDASFFSMLQNVMMDFAWLPECHHHSKCRAATLHLSLCCACSAHLQVASWSGL
jgi:hypothetical protein